MLKEDEPQAEEKLSLADKEILNANLQFNAERSRIYKLIDNALKDQGAPKDLWLDLPDRDHQQAAFIDKKIQEGFSFPGITSGEDLFKQDRSNTFGYIKKLGIALKNDGDPQKPFFWSLSGDPTPEPLALLLSLKRNGKYIINLHDSSSIGFPPIALAANEPLEVHAALLMAAGADPHLKGKDGLSAFDYPRVQQNESVRALLGDPAADPLKLNHLGKNAIYYAKEARKITQMFAQDFDKQGNKTFIDNTQRLRELDAFIKDLERRAAEKHKNDKDMPKTGQNIMSEDMKNALERYELLTASGHTPERGAANALSQKPMKDFGYSKRMA